MREDEVRAVNTIAAFKAFEGMALHLILDHPPEPTSGLVKQQRWFRIAAQKQELTSE